MDLKGLEAGLRRAHAAALRRAEQGLATGAAKVLHDAQESVPVDTGALRDSGSVEVENGVAAVGFSDPAAVTVHERIDVVHPQGEAHFLSGPLIADRTEVGEIMADHLRQAF